MPSLENTAKSAIAILFFSLLSKVLGFLREVLIASNFGSGFISDTYFVAIIATGVVTAIIIQVVSTILIPMLFEIENNEGKKNKIYHINNILNILILISILIVILWWFASPIIVRILASGFKGEQLNLAIQLTRIGLPSIVLSCITGVLTGFLNSENKHGSPSAIGIPFNFVYIFYLVFLSNIFGIKGLMVSGIVASLTQILIQIPEARKYGFKYKFVFNIKDKYVKKMFILSMPIFASMAVNDINVIIDRTIASKLTIGSISSLNYANKLRGIILSVFIAAITTVIFPLLSKETNNNNMHNMKKIMGYGINLILIITVPATVGLIVLAVPIVKIAFQRGEFDMIATLMTSKALVFYSLGLISMSLNLLISKVFYSLQDTKTPMLNSFISVILNIMLNFILVKFLGHAGLALATSIATTLATIMLLYGLKKKIGPLGTKEYIITFFKTGLASVIMGLVAYVVYYGLYGMLGVSKLYNLVSLLVAVGLAVIVYGVLCYLFRVDEVRDMVDKIRERFRLF